MTVEELCRELVKLREHGCKDCEIKIGIPDPDGNSDDDYILLDVENMCLDVDENNNDVTIYAEFGE